MFKKGDKVQFKKNWREIALGIYSNANTVNKIARHKEKTLTFKKYTPSSKKKKKGVNVKRKKLGFYMKNS